MPDVPLDLRPDHLRIVRAILHRHVPQREVWAFGSRVKWTAKEYSDLDLAVISDQPLPLSVSAALADDFADSDLPFKVDVVDWATTSESFRKIILKDKLVVQTGNMPTCSASTTQIFRESNSGLPCISRLGDGYPIGWQNVRLGDVTNYLTGFPFKSSGYVDDPDAPRLLRGDNIVQGAIRWDGAKRWPQEQAAELAQYWLAERDIVLAMDRPWIEAGLKYAALTTYDLPSLLVQRVARLRGTDNLDVRFLKYVIAGQDFINYVLSVQTGTAVPHISGGQIRDFQFFLPPIHEQRAIASILATIDEKRELNCRQNSILETMARVLFQSWFVDFKPVSAKAEGRQPFGIDTFTAALFSDAFEDSELGEIPIGWRATTLSEIVTERTVRVGVDNDHVVLSAVNSGELKLSDEHFTKQVYSQDTAKYKKVEQWDYAYNPSRINIGSIGMLEEPLVGAVSPIYVVLRPEQGYEWFLRFFLDLPQTQEVINQFCSGSVRQSLSFRDFASIPVVLPPKPVAEAFTWRWLELNTLRRNLEAQSKKLAETRDVLLPKLMSGEVRVNLCP